MSLVSVARSQRYSAKCGWRVHTQSGQDFRVSLVSVARGQTPYSAISGRRLVVWSRLQGEFGLHHQRR